MTTLLCRFTGLFSFIVFLIGLPATGRTQCVTLELIMINSCIEHPNPNNGPVNVESEIIIMRTGIVPVEVNTIGIDLPFNGFGAQNDDVGLDPDGDPYGCGFKQPTITTLPGCPSAIPAGANDLIPANALIVVFLTSTTITDDVANTDFTNICQDGQPVYILQSACERTTGAFANGPGQGNPLRTLAISSPCGPSITTYNTSVLDPDDGTYYIVGTSITGNQDCEFPVLPPTCQPIDTSFYLCGYGATVDPPVPVSDFTDFFPPEVLLISMHESPEEAELNDNRLAEYSGPTGQPDTLYSRVIYRDNLCTTVGRFIIQFPDTAFQTMVPAEPVRGCDPLSTGVGIFNLRLSDPEVGGVAPVTWYTDPAGTQEIVDPAAFNSPSTTVYAVAGFGACAGELVPVELELSAGPVLVSQADPAACAGVANGAITVSATGFEPFTYDWNLDSLDGNSGISNLEAGAYQLTVTDRYGCFTAGDFVVQTSLDLAIDCEVVQGTSGPSAADGAVRLNFMQGTSPFQLSYSGAAAGAVEVNGTSVDLNDLPSGDYTFSYTDANGCTSDTCSINVPLVNPLLLQCLTRSNSNDVNVLGGGQVIISGGEAPFTVTISDAGGNDSSFPNLPNGLTLLPDLPSGMYTVTVTDAAGLMETCSFNIALIPCPLTIVEVQQLATDCSGTNNTIIRLTIAGNDGAISTTWSGGNGIDAFDGMQEAGPLPPGVYFVTVGDQSACPTISEGPIVITDPGPIDFTVAGDFTASPCQDDARIDVTVNGGGSPPYDVVLIDWNTSAELDRILGQPAGTTVSFPNLAGGGAPDYAVYIIDALGCETTRTFNPIAADSNPDLILNVADQQIIPPSCNGDSTGQLTLLASGGTAPYNYRWIDYPQRTTGRTLSDGPNQTDLPPGDYLIEITDANGCLDSATVVMPQGNSPTIICGPTTLATANQGGSVTIDYSGSVLPYGIVLIGEDFQDIYPNLTGNSEQITDLQPGAYAALVRDGNGCASDTCRFTISQLACSLSAVATIDTIVCRNAPQGRISLALSGGAAPYTYSWGPGVNGTDDDVRVFAEGDYPVSIEDANGCTLDTSFFVPNLMLQTQLNLETPRYLPACSGGDIQIPLEFLGTGPFVLEYFVNPAPGVDFFRTFTTSQQFDTLIVPATDFFDNDLRVSVQRLTDQFCENRINQTFLVRYSEPDTVRRTEATCDTAPIEIAGRFFDVQNPSDTFLFDDGSTCGVVYEVDIDFMMGAVPDTVVVPICPATPYEENGEVFDANRTEGEVRYLRPGLCDSIVYVRLDILPESVGSFSGNACVGDTIFYADRFFTAESPSGLARLPGMAATGCDSLVFVSTSFRRTGEVRLFGDFEICPGEPIELRFTYDGPGAIDVRMQDQAGNITDLSGIRQGSRVELFPTESTTYQLLSSGIGGCPGEVAGSSSVIVNDLAIGAEVVLDPGDYCQDTLGLAAVTYSGGLGPYEIAWSNGPADSINRNLLAGTYRVSVTDAIGCTLVDSVMLNSLNPLTARVSGVPPVCPGENGSLRIDTIFGGGGFYEVSINGQFFLPVEQVADIQVPVGNHRAVFQGANDCSVAVNFRVADALRPDFDLPQDTTILLGDSIFLDGSLLNQDTAWWSPPNHLSDPNTATTWANPASSTNYTLHLRTLAQCLFTHNVNITVDERLLVYAPTAFSPNGDGTNDRYALGLGRNVVALKTFQVFNRWGSLMYEGTDGWNGEFNGASAPPAAYVFYAIVEMADGSERFVKGDFLLMR
jgi:gliding motility-associated-like protein